MLKESSGLNATGEDHCANPRIGDQCLTHLVIRGRYELQHVLGYARCPERLGQMPADQNRFGCGFENDGVAGHQRRQHPTGGNGEREVPWRGDHHHAEWCQVAIGYRRSQDVRVQGARIVTGEVDRFGYLWVGFADGLAGIEHHRANEVAAAASQLYRNF